MHNRNAWRTNTSAMMYEVKVLCTANKQIRFNIQLNVFHKPDSPILFEFTFFFFFIYSYNFSNRFSTPRNVPLISHAYTPFEWNDGTRTNHNSTKTTYWNGIGHLWEKSWQSNFNNCRNIPNKRFLHQITHQT